MWLPSRGDAVVLGSISTWRTTQEAGARRERIDAVVEQPDEHALLQMRA